MARAGYKQAAKRLRKRLGQVKFLVVEHRVITVPEIFAQNIRRAIADGDDEALQEFIGDADEHYGLGDRERLTVEEVDS